jgi:hypothetical protein
LLEFGGDLLVARWNCDIDRGQEELEDGAGVVAEAAVAVARIG